MKTNMKEWVKNLISSQEKQAIPVLSFPAVQLLGINVRELIADSDVQAEGMVAIAQRYPTGACVSMMDLSVEAECFGADIEVLDEEIPRIVSTVVHGKEDAEKPASR